MKPDSRSGNAARRYLVGIAAVIGIAVAVAWWQKPWADSAMVATVSLSTDENGIVFAREIRVLFSADDARDPPQYRLECDLSPWEGRLVRLEVSGSVRKRLTTDGSTGFVGCRAQVLTESGPKPLEFASWQRGSEIGLHTSPAGPHASHAGGDGDTRFAVASTGTLWHVLKAQLGDRVQVTLKPVFLLELPGRLEPVEPRSLNAPRWPLHRRGEDRGRPPDVFIYLIDALRADHVGCYGYERPTSPSMDSFADEAALYHNAQAPATWTRPSVATMLSGLSATVHGAMHTCDRLAEWPVLLPEILHDAGYVTRCISANMSVSADFGFDHGYDEFISLHLASGQWVNKMAARRLRAEDPSQPVFMFLHIMEPHGPYVPREETFRLFDRGFEGRCDGSTPALNALPYLYPDLSDDDVQHLIDLYDAQIFEADQAFSEFIEMLRELGRYDNSVIVLVSDHGEAFTEHDTRAHGFDLNQETMRVVLTIRFPHGDLAGVRVQQPVSLTDLLPTLLAEAGLKPELPYALPGRDLRHAAMLPDSETSRRIYCEVARLDDNAVDLVGVIDEDGFKRVIDVSVVAGAIATRRSTGLWNTLSDPREEVDLADEWPVRAAYGEQLIAQWLLDQKQWRDRLHQGPQPAPEIPESLKEQLRALGYLGAPIRGADRGR